MTGSSGQSHAASIALTFAPSWFGTKSMNFDFIVLGVIGLFGGMVANSETEPFAIKGKWSAAGCLLAIVILMKYLSGHLTTYALGTIVILKLLYDLGAAIGATGRVAGVCILLGQYSLVCYIAQIVFLQAVYRVVPKPPSNSEFETVFVVFATVIFLIALSAVLATLRKRHKFIAGAYKFVFS